MRHGEQNQPDTPGQKERGVCSLTETDKSWWGCVPLLLSDASNDFTETNSPLPSLSLSATANKEWSDTKLHSLLFSHPQILRKMFQISGEPQEGDTQAVLLAQLPL